MKIVRLLMFALLTVAPLSASAAIVKVTFGGDIYESYDENFDPVFDYFTMEGSFFVDTSTPQIGSFGTYPYSVFGLETRRDGIPLLDQLDFFTCPPPDINLCANEVDVGTSDGAYVYVQDFFVGNISLNLVAAPGEDFMFDIAVFEDAALGNVEDYFDIFSSDGSIQVDGEDYFYLYELTMEIVAVPVPAAAWLFGSALLGLVGIGRRKA